MKIWQSINKRGLFDVSNPDLTAEAGNLGVFSFARKSYSWWNSIGTWTEANFKIAQHKEKLKDWRNGECYCLRIALQQFLLIWKIEDIHAVVHLFESINPV